MRRTNIKLGALAAAAIAAVAITVPVAPSAAPHGTVHMSY